MVSGIEEGQGCHLCYEVWTQSCPGMMCSRTYVHSVHWRWPMNLHGNYYLWERRSTHCCHFYHANNCCLCQHHCYLNMSPHKLELMLFINENFLPPSIFDKVMKWVLSATANGYKFHSPSYSTLKKQNEWTTHSPILLMVVVLSNLRYSYQKRLDQTSQWQCGSLSTPLEMFAKSFMTWGSWRDFANNSKGILKVVPHCHWEVWSNLFW